MKNLLTAIKTQLQTDLTYIRGSDIFIAEGEWVLPAAIKFPAVGLKDGDTLYSQKIQGASEESELFVIFFIYVQLFKPEASIMGDPATGKKGVLEIVADIITALKENLFSSQANEAWVVSEGGSELATDEEKNISIQMKTVTLRYVRYGTYS